MMNALKINIDGLHNPVLPSTITPCRLFFPGVQFKQFPTPDFEFFGRDAYEPYQMFVEPQELEKGCDHPAIEQPNDGGMLGAPVKFEEVIDSPVKSQVYQLVDNALEQDLSLPDLYRDSCNPLASPAERSYDALVANKQLFEELNAINSDVFTDLWLQSPAMRSDPTLRRQNSSRCWVTGCDKMCKSNLDLLFHLSSHKMAERLSSSRFFCGDAHCHYRFIGFGSKSAAIRHKKVKHDSKLKPSCFKCGRIFQRPDSAYRHFSSLACGEQEPPRKPSEKKRRIRNVHGN